ncbi:hypothetical protein [Ferroacidibacillus organovorans]|uniref:Uncharacterized protein n=1 Tax=Ferroacidibacillus organovorans TaxID=1765683 RepID=A0A853K9M2_9BACL|nr:hypothetical protein [Ferroacidibacillus organovorans]KYP81132.1 hypothetical protein AYJ22_08610 [Ferroacidibacillus organovorans]OAG93098.1 hypothetical protein AYW79_12360 [Ferroacidibacillus organovorans]
MAGAKDHAVQCNHCGSTNFKEEKIVALDASVMITKGMKVPAQTVSVSYQYTCTQCQTLLDESFEGGHLKVK